MESCRFEHIRGNFCGFSAFTAAAAAAPLKRDPLFGEIKPDGNNFFIPKQSSDVHLHLRIKSYVLKEQCLCLRQEMRLEKRSK